MDYNVIDWDVGSPGLDAFARDWEKTVITALKPTDIRLVAVAKALDSTHCNGGAEVAQFRIDSVNAVSWFLTRNRLTEAEFFRHFFTDSNLVKALPLISAPNELVDNFEMEGSFVAIGRLAQVICQGGAFQKFAGGDAEAMKLAHDFAQAAFGNRYSTTVVWVNWTAWCSYFCDIAWDGTFVFFDKSEGVMTVLTFTDTD